jgi:PAS domain S-box-containing protein
LSDRRREASTGFLEAVHETSQQLSGRAQGDDLLRQIVTSAAKMTGTPHGYVCLRDPDGDEDELVLQVGIGAFECLVGLRIRKGEGVAGRVWDTAAPYAVTDYTGWADRIHVENAPRLRAVLGVPLLSGGLVTGVIGLGSLEPGRAFSEAETAMIEQFAELASIALETSRRYAASVRSEERYRTLVEMIPALVYSEDLKDGAARMYTNRYVETMFGFTQEEASDVNSWKAQLHPDDRERVLAEEARCDQTGEPFRMEYRSFTRDGRVVWVRDECVLLRDEDDTPLYWQGVVFDITEPKLAEQRVKAALERERQAAQRLRSLDEMKNTFLDAVSHELRTPLAAVIGISLTLERAGDELEPADSTDLIARLVANARKLDRLLTDLLDLDRLSRGIVAPKRRPTDVAALVQRVAEEWCLLNGREVDLDTEPANVSLDAGKVERIVENLLANASRHTDADTPIWVRLRRESDGVLLAIEDAGPGVPPALKASVFEAFRRGPEVPAHAPGVGIGLSLVARFAQLHGGRAWVDDRPGGGSSFRVFLPDAPARRASDRLGDDL